MIPALLLIQIGWWIYIRKKQNPTLLISEVKHLETFGNPILSHIKNAMNVLRLTVVVLLLIALARPQSSYNESKVTTEGIDIVMSIDVSSSMLAQ
ncbi:MAG: aerotolerance regulator BatA, partial [Polaribacter sp.]|nr:aerotolerance regulator BatA [Polaribacter sp.]